MVKQTKAYGVLWNKNDTADGGALKHTLTSKTPDQIVIHSQTQKNGRMWATTDPETFLSMLQKNNGYYEVINEVLYKVFFDIDHAGETTADFLDTVKQIILEFFPDAEFAISGSINQMKGDKITTSFHVVLTNYIITSKDEQDTLKAIVNVMKQKNDAFDTRVYTRNRQMKAVNQSKDDGRIQAILENADIKEHLITCFFPQNPLLFPQFKGDTADEIKIQKAIHKTTNAPFNIGQYQAFNAPYDGRPYNELSPLDILNLLPLDNSGTYDFAYTCKGAVWAYYNGLTYENFAQWISQKHTDTPKIKRIWDNCGRFPPFPNGQMKALLKAFFPTIDKNPALMRFTATFDFDRNDIVMIDRIEPNHFKIPAKYILFNVGCGAGKTAQSIDYLKGVQNRGQTIAWFAPNRALARNTHGRLLDEHIECFNYEDEDTRTKQTGGLEIHPNLICVINSVHYLETRNYDVVVIDEMETLTRCFFGDFINKQGHKKKSWDNFKRIILNAKKVILLDAFTTTKTLNFIQGIEPQAIKRIYERHNESTNREAIFIKGMENAELQMIDALDRGLRIFIYYPYKTASSNPNKAVIGMEDLHRLLTEKTGKQGIYYHADIDDSIKRGILNVNVAWENQDYLRGQLR